MRLAVASMGGEMVAGTIVSVLQAAADAVEDWGAGGAGLAEALDAAGDAAASALDRTRCNSTCWPTPAWSMRAGAACWCSSTR